MKTRSRGRRDCRDYGFVTAYQYEAAPRQTLYEEYFAFGMTSFHSPDGTVDVPRRRYRYNGKERDEETGLYYYGARYYAAWLGRWTAVDPSTGDGFNAYSYVRNNPIGLADPTGEQAWNSDTGGTLTIDVHTPIARKAAPKADTASKKPTELHVPGRSADAPVNTVVTPKERPQDQTASPPPAAKQDELTAQTGLGRIAEAAAKGDVTTAATEYALAIVTEIPNVAVGMFLFGAAKKAIAAGHAGGGGAAVGSAVESYESYLGGIIPVVPSLIGGFESYQKASETRGSAKVGASVDTYFYSLQAVTQVVGFLGGGGKVGEEANTAEGGWIGRLFEDTTGGVPKQKLKPGDVGAFKDLDRLRVSGDDLTPHHMPQAAQGFTSRGEGGALVLPMAEHELTRTFGARGRATKSLEAGMSFRDVLARDLRDIRSLFGPTYDASLRQLLQYYRVNFPGLMRR